MTVRAILFDLDNCLAAAREVGDALFAPAFEGVRRANRGLLSEEALAAAFSDVWQHAWDWVVARHGFSEAMRRAGWEAFASMEVSTPMQGYGDLQVLAELPGERFLVTSGFRRLQESKVRALGLARHFLEVHVDAIDETPRLGKEAIFAGILARHGWGADEVLVVGDNPHSEIEAGNRLGMPTVQMLRPGVSRSDTARFHVRGLEELKALLVRL